MSRGPSVAVVSRKGDFAGAPCRVVTADEYLAGDGGLLDGDLTILNLCRSWRYLSKGYYVSLLADARRQTALPSVDTIEGLAEPDTIFRRLQEAGVETVDPAEQRSRRRSLLNAIANPEGGAGAPGPPLLAKRLVGDAIVYHPVAETDVAETLVCLGRVEDRRFRKLGAAVHRLWPAPVLRVRLLRETGRWKVIEVGPVLYGRLRREGREALARAVSGGNGGPRGRAPDKATAIAVLFDPQDAFKPSSDETIERFTRVAAEMGVHVHRIEPTEIHRVGEYDALFLRTLTGLDRPAFRFALHAEALGMPVVDDSRSIIRCSNKVFLRELLSRESIPMPNTRTASRDTRFEDLRADLGLPFVLKVPDGSFSAAVFRIRDARQYEERTGELFRSSPLLVAQEWVPTEYDWRVAVLDGRPLFTCRYFMARGHWQILASTGVGVRSGRVEAVPRDRAPRAVVRLACRAAALIGNGLYGVDIKEGPSGPVVIEVNDNPNLDLGYEDTAEGDTVYREIVDHFRKLLRPGARKGRARPAGKPRDAGLAALRAPVGRLDRAPAPPYRAFQVCGLELEYVVVDRDLNVLHGAEELLAQIRGRPTSDVDLGLAGYSNEIFDHVVEVKNRVPLRTIRECEEVLVEAVRRAALVLGTRRGARLLPTGMHPWFLPARARLWRRSNQRIYRTYERLFPVRSHGWANVQASHVNLPIDREDETVAMVNAAALLTPYLPALAASSPIVEGDPGPAVDNRLHFLVTHQARVPESTGDMVPEFVASLAEYRREVLRPMYRAADRLPDAGAIRHEFLNARAAVLKFSRDSMEVRVLDTQECVKMDAAVAAFTRGALRGLAAAVRSGRLALPDRELLIRDFHEAVARGTAARVFAPHLPEVAGRGEDGRVGVRSVLAALRLLAEKNLAAADRPYLDLVDRILETGNLSERILGALRPFEGDDFTEAARRVYIRLADCLVENEPWDGRS